MAASELQTFEDDGGDFGDFVYCALRIISAWVYRLPRATSSLKDRSNAIKLYNDAKALIQYRFTKRMVNHLLKLLPLREGPDNRGNPVSPLLQLLPALRFYRTATFQKETGDLAGIWQPTVCRTIAKISEVIAKELFPRLVRFWNATEMPVVIHDVHKIALFLGGTGCIDCTHVRTKSPSEKYAEVFRNRKRLDERTGTLHTLFTDNSRRCILTFYNKKYRLRKLGYFNTLSSESEKISRVLRYCTSFRNCNIFRK